MKNCSGLFWIQSSFIYLFHVSPRATRVRRCLSGLLKLTVLYKTDLFYHSEHASYIPKKCDIIKSVRYVARIVVTCNSLIWKWVPKLSTRMSFSSSTLACDTAQTGYQASKHNFYRPFTKNLRDIRHIQYIQQEHLFLYIGHLITNCSCPERKLGQTASQPYLAFHVFRLGS